jgi:hypothetical protein
MPTVTLARDLRTSLRTLGLSQTEAAKLLSVTARTVRRWVENPDELQGPAARALEAWLALERRGLPWRPDEASVEAGDEDQIVRMRAHAVELYGLLERVRLRGGPALPWQIDLTAGTATLETVRVSFYKLANGGFSPQAYRLTGSAQSPSDENRMTHMMLEDAVAAFAHALGLSRPDRFEFETTLQGDSILLWDIQRMPTVVLKMSCAIVRRELIGQAAVTDEQCRFLVHCNREQFAELAADLYRAGRYDTRADGIQVIEPRGEDLATIAGRFSTSVLSVVPFFVAMNSPRTERAADYTIVALAGGEFAVRAQSTRAEARNPGRLKIGSLLAFKSRSELQDYVAAAESAGFTVAGLDSLQRR